RLEHFRKQLLAAAKAVPKRPKRHGSQMDAHHFGEMLGWLLAKGRQDPDAREAASILARQVADNPDSDGRELLTPLLPVMLADFAALVWPTIGKAIVADRAKAWRIEHALGDSYSFEDAKKPPLLHLPEDILFAWCHAHPDVGPAFIASVLPVLTTN